MDTITFTGQLLVATQNDTCKALNVIINNTSESCCNGCDVAIAGIICGAVVLVALFAKIILLRKLKIDSEWKTLQVFIEKKKREQEHEWEEQKEKNNRKELLEDREYKRECEKDDRIFQKEKEINNKELDARLEKEKLELQTRHARESNESKARLDRESMEFQARMKREEQEFKENKANKRSGEKHNNTSTGNTETSKQD